MIKILNLKLVILLEHQNIKINLLKAMFQIGLKKFLWLKTLKTLRPRHMLLVTLKVKKLLQCLTNKNCKKNKPKRVKKVIKRKGDKLYVKWKGYDNSVNTWTDKRHSINRRIFSRTEIFRTKSESWIRFV